MGYSEFQKQEKESFWSRYKILILGILGAFLLISSLSTQNVIISYQPSAEETYLVKLDYSTFGFCLRCMPGSKNSADVVEKEVFFLKGKEESVLNAVSALQQVAGSTEGTFQLKANGLLSQSDKTTQELVKFLNERGYPTTIIQPK